MQKATDREKRQLEEIAHLFLSDRSEERRTRPPPVRNLPAGAASAAPKACGPAPLWIRPRAAPRDEQWVEFFSLNLALLFQVADEPVVWIPSRWRTWTGAESRLPVRFKARLAAMASADLPLTYCGPMGLRVLPGRAGETGRRDFPGVGWPSGPGIGSLEGYRYVLAEEPRAPLPWETLPCLEVWLVGVPPAEPRTRDEDGRGSEEARFHCRSAFVVVGAASEDEARAAGLRWKEAQGMTASGWREPENLGFIPGPLPAAVGAGPEAMIVLQDPLGWQTRRLQEIASRIRARRPLEATALKSASLQA